MSDTQTLATGDWLRLNKRGRWEYLERVRRTGLVDAVILIALTPKRELVFVEQYRASLDCRCIELPAGVVGDEDPNEETLEAAQRELLEETGFHAEQLCILAEGPVSSGLSNERIQFVGATDLERRGDGGGVDDEDITTHVVPLDEVENWLDSQRKQGLDVDVKVYAALFFARSGLLVAS